MPGPDWIWYILIFFVIVFFLVWLGRQAGIIK